LEEKLAQGIPLRYVLVSVAAHLFLFGLISGLATSQIQKFGGGSEDQVSMVDVQLIDPDVLSDAEAAIRPAQAFQQKSAIKEFVRDQQEVVYAKKVYANRHEESEEAIPLNPQSIPLPPQPPNLSQVEDIGEFFNLASAMTTNTQENLDSWAGQLSEADPRQPVEFEMEESPNAEGEVHLNVAAILSEKQEIHDLKGSGMREVGLFSTLEGSREGGEKERDEFLLEIRQRLEEAKRYPRIARLKGHEGIARIRFFIEPSGIPEDIRLVTSSGWRILDEEAIEMVRRVGRFSNPPAQWPNGIQIHVPLVFELDDPSKRKRNSLR
jgi:TonB family protein